MSKKIRKTGIDFMGDVPWGTHFCQFYKTKKDLIDILVPYFKAGLENNEFCMWVTSKPLSEKDAAKALAKVLPDLDSYLKKGQIEIIPHDKWYMRNAVFNSKRVLKGWLKKLDKAMSKGYDGLRLTGNTFWLEKKDWNSFTNYEKEVDSVISEHNIIALCTYSLDKCGANEVIDVVQNHQFVLIKRESKWELIESSERKRAEDEIKRFASFPQLNPNPILEVDSSGTIVFCNAATVQALRKLNLRDTTLFLPNDLSDILDALEQEKNVQFYSEVKIKDRIFGEVLCLTPQFDSIRIYANDITERKSYQEALKNALHKSRQHEGEMSALSNASRSILKYPDFKSTAREIFDYCKQLIGATSGYIALLSKDGTENEVFFLDSGGLPCSVDPELPMPIRGLRAEAYHSMKTVYHNDFLNTDWMKFLPNGHVKLRNVLFAPLLTDGKPVGLLGLANKTGGFTDNDARIASAFGDLAAIALTQKHTQENLRHSEEYFRLVTDNALDVLSIIETDGTIRYASLSTEQVLGYKPEDLIGKNVFELVHPADLPKAKEFFSQSIQEPDISLSLELRSRHKDGSLRIFEVKGKNLLGNPAVAGIVISSRDVTEHKRIDEALHYEKEKLLNILDSMEDGVYIVNHHYDIEYINPILKKEYGQVNGRKCYEYFEGQKEACSWCKNKEVFEGKTVRSEWYSSKTGKTYDLVDTPLRNPDGSISKLQIFRDITKRKKMEEEIRKLNMDLEKRVVERTAQLHESREQLQSILDNATAVIYLKDTEGRFILINRQFEKLFNITKEEVLGKTDHELWPKEIADTFRKNDLEVLKKHAPLEVEEIAPHTDGIHTYISVKFPLFDSVGVPYGVCGISTDITARKTAEKIIKDQSDILDSLFKDTITPLVLLDNNFNFLRVNEAYAKACNQDINALKGHNHFEFYPHEENETIFRKVVEEKFPYQAIAKPFVFPDHPEWGVTYWDWTLTPLLNEYGEVKFLIFSLNDVTERMQSEKAVEAERQRLYSVLENLPAYVCLLNPDYTFAYVNQEFKRIFGHPGNRKCYDYLFNCMEPCEGCQTYKIFTERKDEQQWEWIGPNGNIYSIYDYAFTDTDGSPMILEMGLDITERKHSENALRESEERYRMLVETMNEGLGMDDENGLLVYANGRLCEMLGYSQEEIIGRSVLSFFDKKNQKILKEQIEKRKRGENEPYRIEWMGKDNQKIITMLSPKGIFDENGNYRGSFAVITDITEKLRLESIAQAVNTMNSIGFIFSGIRHEIGNPVNSIKMALSVLKQNIDSYSIEKVKEYTDRMLSEISRMEYLLKVMKNFNMYETVELMDTEMTDFINKFLSLVKGDLEKRGIKVDTFISEPAWVYADPRALQQVLLNILTNASDSLEGRKDPRILLSVSKLADMINIRIEDNGCGMTEQQQEDLFKPFYTTKSKGTGLGLVIAKKMMTMMKGFIEVVSDKDKGTVVDLFIPEGISE